MFDFTTLLAEIPEWTSAALSVIDPTTSMGGLVMVSLGLGVVFMAVRKFKRIVPK